MNFIYYLTELIGAAAFSLAGASIAIEKDFDLFGVLVLGCTTACGGGMVRDMLLGALPPVMFRNPSYVALAALVAMLLFVGTRYGGDRFARLFSASGPRIDFLDSLGLGVFAVSGVKAAAAAGYLDNAFLAVFVGVLTGVGGGMLRDVLAGDVPAVLSRRIYATAALCGAFAYYELLRETLLGDTAAVWLSVALVMLIRFAAERRQWQLPRARPPV